MVALVERDPAAHSSWVAASSCFTPRVDGAEFFLPAFHGRRSRLLNRLFGIDGDGKSLYTDDRTSKRGGKSCSRYCGLRRRGFLAFLNFLRGQTFNFCTKSRMPEGGSAALLRLVWQFINNRQFLIVFQKNKKERKKEIHINAVLRCVTYLYKIFATKKTFKKKLQKYVPSEYRESFFFQFSVFKRVELSGLFQHVFQSNLVQKYLKSPMHNVL